MWGDIAIAFLLACITSFVVTPYSIKLARKVDAVDMPKDERRINSKPMPRLGGIAIVSGFLVSMAYLLAVMSIEGTIDLFGQEQYGIKMIGLLCGIIVLAITCFIDDSRDLPPPTKLAGQLIAAIIVIYSGIRIENLNLPFLNEIGLNYPVSIITTLGWIIGITNAINLIDGLDGLSSGIGIISCLSLLIIFSLNYSPLIAILLVTALAGALIGFLPFNFNPAKTFMGDTGSNFLGFLLAIISILGIAKTYTVMVIIAPLIVLALPIFDTLWAIIRRVITGKSIKAIVMPDKGHLHHRLMAKGYSQKQSVLILYAISATFGMFAVILLDSGIWKALSFALMVVAVVAIGSKNLFKLKEEGEKMYKCSVCGYEYNPEETGIAFEDLPDDWVCPVCGVGKDKFVNQTII